MKWIRDNGADVLLFAFESCQSMYDHHSGALYNAAPFLVVRVNRDGERERQRGSSKKPPPSKVVIVEELLNLASITEGRESRLLHPHKIFADVEFWFPIWQYETLSYRLFASVEHFGSAEQGLYTADILQGQQWRRYNDGLPPIPVSPPSGKTCNTVKQTDGSEAPQWAPAILFYQLTERKEAGQVDAEEEVEEVVKKASLKLFAC